MPNEPTNIIRHIALRPLLRHNSGMHVSVIVTVYNERSSIERLLDSLGRQTRRPDEIVICDGGSRDGTADLIRQYCADNADVYPPLRLLVEPGANISRGRNLAIDAAQGPVIAATDAGVRLADDWLEQLVAAWDRAVDEPDAPLAVAGFFLPDIDGVFQTAMSATVLPLADDIDPDTFLPSSRSVAFTKQAWASAGGYPEWLDYCEDLLFDFGINDQVPNRPSGFAVGARCAGLLSAAGEPAQRSGPSTIAMRAATARPICGASAMPPAMESTLCCCPPCSAMPFSASSPAGSAGWVCWSVSFSIAGDRYSVSSSWDKT